MRTQSHLCRTMSSISIMLMTVVFVYAPKSVSAKDDSLSSNCSASFRCGNLTDIGYPFYGGDQPSYCGYPGFELTDCSSQAPVINITGLTYQVLEIFRITQTLKVARTDFLENICSASLQNTTLDYELFDFTSDSENITIYYDCPEIPTKYTATPSLSTNISCNDTTDITCYYSTSEVAAVGLIDALSSCSTNITVPAYKSNIASMGRNRSLTQENLVSTLSQGFGLQWIADVNLCEKCSTSGGQCGYDDTTSSFVCFCQNQTQPLSCPSSSTGRSRTDDWAQDDNRYSNCSASFRCGNLTDIGYPFYGGNRASYCGYPGFKLTDCTTQAALITIMELTYQVLEIFNETQTVKVARTDYLKNVCPSNLYNTTLNHTLFDFSSDSQNIMIYYDCPQIPNFGFSTRISCKANRTVSVTSYYVTPNMTTNTYLTACNYRVYVPAYASNIRSLENSLTQENLVSTLNQGFGLHWKAEDNSCEICRLSGGQCGYNDTTASFVCFCPNQTLPYACPSSSTAGQPGTGKKSQRKLVIGLSIAGAIAVVVGTGCYYLYANTITFGRNDRNHNQIEEIIRNNDSLIPKRCSYSEIKKMTNSFKEKLGEGGFGSVYKGKLENGDAVAVKFLSKSKDDGANFMNEVASFSRTSHVNVVRLLGFCYEGSKRALIYEYMSNGSLDKFIYDQRSSPHKDHLKWHKLYEIAIGIARGLEYLHRGCTTRIVHFDIKPHNILLDEDFCPKISDFGLAKLSKTRESRMSMLDARGTIGYIAPEVIYRNFGEVSYRADVYSYGMMVLQIIGARKNINVGPSETYFPDWIYEHIESVGISRIHEIVAGANAEDINDEERISKMMIVGLWCIQMYPSDRPSMTKVVEMLEGSLESLQVPPKPVSCSSVVRLSSPNSSTTASQIPAIIPLQHQENSSGINEL